MKAQVYDLDRKEVGEIELNDAVFGVEVREHLFWEVVNWEEVSQRFDALAAGSKGEL